MTHLEAASLWQVSPIAAARELRREIEAKIAAELASLEETFTLWPDKARMNRIARIRDMRAELIMLAKVD